MEQHYNYIPIDICKLIDDNGYKMIYGKLKGKIDNEALKASEKLENNELKVNNDNKNVIKKGKSLIK